MKAPAIVQEVAAAAGGVPALAAQLGISRIAVYAWKRIPAERVIAVERISGVPRERLRPDLYPPSTVNPQ